VISRHSITSGISLIAASRWLKRSGRVLVHRNVDQRHQRQAERFRVQQRPVAGDQPGFFERAHPAQAGRRRQADAVGEFLIADAALLLQDLQNLPVKAIELHAIALIFSMFDFYIRIF
jgi:hypothetical protein